MSCGSVRGRFPEAMEFWDPILNFNVESVQELKGVEDRLS